MGFILKYSERPLIFKESLSNLIFRKHKTSLFWESFEWPIFFILLFFRIISNPHVLRISFYLFHLKIMLKVGVIKYM